MGRNLRSVNTDGGVNLQFKLLSAIGIIIIVSGHCYHGGMELITGFRRIRIIWHCLYLYRDIFTKPIMKKISENTYGNEQSGFLFLRICGIYFTVVWLHFSVCLDLL